VIWNRQFLSLLFGIVFFGIGMLGVTGVWKRKAGKDWEKIASHEGSLKAWIREIQRKRSKRKS
jgi:hypothetical protein